MSSDNAKPVETTIRHKHAKSKKRKRSGEPGDEDAEYDMLQHAVSGSLRKARKLLRHHPEIGLDTFDSTGQTALHLACRHGHRDFAKWLLRHGADIQAEDLAGNTPAHLAAERGYLRLLADLLKAKPPVDVDARNVAGQTVRELSEAALHDASGDDEPAAAAESSEPGWEPPAAWRAADGAGVQANDWQARLMAEAEADGIDDAWAWESYADGDPTGFPSTSRPTHRESEDDYARRIWEAMERRKGRAGGQTGVSAATAAAWGAADSEQEQRRRAREAAAESAKRESRRVLEEEQARDRAWREAVLRGDVSTRRAAYEARWRAIIDLDAGMPLSYEEIPWIEEPTPEGFNSVVLCGADTPAGIKKRLRTELIRWHPDKFVGRFGARLVAADKERVLQRVKQVSQALNALSADV